MTASDVVKWHLPAVRRYLAHRADMSHPKAGWYVQVADGLPIGPFPDMERADRAVEAIEAVLTMQSKEGTT
jgi:hypothetical protein